MVEADKNTESKDLERDTVTITTEDVESIDDSSSKTAVESSKPQASDLT